MKETFCRASIMIIHFYSCHMSQSRLNILRLHQTRPQAPVRGSDDIISVQVETFWTRHQDTGCPMCLLRLQCSMQYAVLQETGQRWPVAVTMHFPSGSQTSVCSRHPTKVKFKFVNLIQYPGLAQQNCNRGIHFFFLIVSFFCWLISLSLSLQTTL